MVTTPTATILTRPTTGSPISLITDYQFVDILHQVIVPITHLLTILLLHIMDHLTESLLEVRIDGDPVHLNGTDQRSIDPTSITAPTWMTNLTTAHQKMDPDHFPRVHITEKGPQITPPLLHPTLTVLHHPHITVKTALRLHRHITNAHRHLLRKNKSSWKAPLQEKSTTDQVPLLAHHLTAATVLAKSLQL
jgi:hypothetical protein